MRCSCWLQFRCSHCSHWSAASRPTSPGRTCAWPPRCRTRQPRLAPDLSVLLTDLVATSQSVAATPKRSEKIAALAVLLRSLTPDEIAPAVGFLTGEPRQGRVGVGWATMMRRPGGGGDEGEHTIGDLDRLIDDIAATTGAGSQSARRQLLD